METKKEELLRFLRYINDNKFDSWGHFQLSDNPNEYSESFEEAVDEFISSYPQPPTINKRYFKDSDHFWNTIRNGEYCRLVNAEVYIIKNHSVMGQWLLDGSFEKRDDIMSWNDSNAEPI